MKLRELAKTAARGLDTNRSRSALTILGIVIGITAIIVIMSLGQGAQSLILGEVQSIGSRVIAVIPGTQPTGPTGFISTFTDSLKNADVIALENKANVPHAAVVIPIVFGSETVSWQGNTYGPTIFGATPAFADIFNVTPAEGNLFTDDDVSSYASVAVIGDKVKTQLFGQNAALGQNIQINNHSFRVVGVLASTGQVSFLNFDDAVVMPWTTEQAYVSGIHYFNRIIVEADSDSTVSETVNDITTTLRNDHNITDPSKDDFFVETATSAVATVSTILNVLTLFLAAVAAISLVVGGIGIMNIMLVAVTERTQEIGLRKALGATNRDILTQFLIEAVILTAAGGVIGIALGGAISFAVSSVVSHVYSLNWPFALPLTAVLLGLGVSSAIGLVFGIYPARQAAKKSPIEALRYE
jgi:putative ABC transport system permease protein